MYDKDLGIYPQRLDSVREFEEANKLIEVYKAEYIKRYKVEPIFSMNRSDHQTLAEILKSLGYERSVMAIKQYLKMNGSNDWFTKKGHSLDVLKKDLNLVNAAIQKTISHEPRHGIPIELNFSCDNCFNYFKLRCDASHSFKSKILCPDCLKTTEGNV